MYTQHPAMWRIAAIGVILLGGVGCAAKGMHATSEAEYSQSGSAGSGSEGADASSMGRGPGGGPGGGIAEHELGSPGLGGFGAGGMDAGGFAMRPEGVDGNLGPGGVPDPLEGMGDQDALPDMAVRGSVTELHPLGGFEQLEPGEAPAEDRVEEGLNVAKIDPANALESQFDSLERDRVSDAATELEDVFFSYDSWRISEEARETLRRDAAWLSDHPGMRLVVEGHCDEQGASSYNLVLGEKRAKAVRNFLAELGVRPVRVNVVSYGEERPFCPEPTQMCYQLNRRGHLFIKSQ